MTRRTSRTVDIDGAVHYVDYGGAGSPGCKPVVCVHGLGGSHMNWWALGPLLAKDHRVLAVDLPGFGLSPPQRRRATIAANTDLLHRFIVETQAAPAVVVGNSMGAMTALHLAARHPEVVSALVLLDPSLPGTSEGRLDHDVVRRFVPVLVPGLGEQLLRRRRARLGPEGVLRETLLLCCASPDAVAADLTEANLAFVRERWGSPHAEHVFLEAARSLVAVLANRTAYNRVINAVAAPTLLLHGACDRLVPLASAARVASRRRDWTFEILDDVGHVPQIEAPEDVARRIIDWLVSVSGQGRSERCGTPGPH